MTTEAEPVERVDRPKVAAAVLYFDTESQAAAFAAVAEQVYEPSRIVVVGGAEEGAGFAAAKQLHWVESLEALAVGLEKDFEFVWVVHGDAVPRQDALQALVGEARRADASVVGSKVLKYDVPDQLESVGGATDVLGEAYLGLDDNEVDLAQYDVVRDVGFVAVVSLLIRRDLLRGLRGLDPLQPPDSAGIDLSQRARLAGGAVIVAPSSEVLHRRACEAGVADWREQAGRMRSMFIAYRAITLLWTIPLGLLFGLFEGIGRLLLGRISPLVNTIKAVAWNVAYLPATVMARRRLALIRHAGDEELFRYQVSGFVRMKNFFADVGERLGLTIDAEPGAISEEEMERDKSVAGPVVAGIVLVFAAMVARQLWTGTAPATGYMLPPGNPGDVLWAYGGGWNATGLGTPVPPHSAAAVVAFLQGLLFSPASFSALTNLAAGVLGIFGFSRLMSRLGAEGAARHVGGFVYAVGPAAVAIGHAGYWPATLALGVFPWALAAVIQSSSEKASSRRRLGYAGAAMVTGGLLGGLAPLAGLAVIAASLVALAFGLAKPASLIKMLVSVLAGVVVAGPYLHGVDVDRLLGGFTIDPWPVSRIVVAGVLVAVVTGVIAGRHWALMGWGGVLLGIGLVMPAWDSFGGEISVVAILLVATGSGVIVSEAWAAVRSDGPLTGAIRTVGALAALVVVLASLAPLVDGRLGYAKESWDDRFRFATALGDDPGRILLITDPSRMPSEYRVGPGFAYRLIDGFGLTFAQAWLYEPRNGDVALGAILNNIAALNITRPGETFAEFGIRWVVVQEGLDVDDAFVTQYDMAKLPLMEGFSVYSNEKAHALFAGPDGPWERRGVLAAGDARAGLVKTAYNADNRFRPNPGVSGWAATVSPEKGAIGYSADPIRKALAFLGLLVILGGVGMVFWGRETEE